MNALTGKIIQRMYDTKYGVGNVFTLREASETQKQ